MLGGVRRWFADRQPHAEAVLDVDGDPSEVIDAYEKELAAQGWTVHEFGGPPQGGFVPANVIGEGRAFQRGDEGPVLMVAAMKHTDQVSDVRIRLDWEMPRHGAAHSGGFPPGMERVPTLRLPPDIEMTGGGGSGGGPNDWTTQARARTSRSVAELETHLAAQLAERAWTRVAGSADRGVAWSSWHLPGEGSWRAILLVLAPFAGDQRTLMLRVESAGAVEGGSGYTIGPLR